MFSVTDGVRFGYNRKTLKLIRSISKLIFEVEYGRDFAVSEDDDSIFEIEKLEIG